MKSNELFRLAILSALNKSAIMNGEMFGRASFCFKAQHLKWFLSDDYVGIVPDNRMAVVGGRPNNQKLLTYDN